MKKRILFIYLSRNPLYINLLNNIPDKDLEVHFITGNKLADSLKVSNKIKVHLCKPVNFGVDSLNRKLPLEIPTISHIGSVSKIIKKINPNYIIVTDIGNIYFWQALSYVKKHSNIKLIPFCEFHHFSSKLWIRTITKFLLKRLKKNEKYLFKLLTFTNYGRDFFRNHFENLRVECIPPSPKFISSQKLKHSPYMREGILRILIIARMVPFKRYDTLLNACRILKEKGIKFKLSILVGGGAHPLRKKVISDISDMNLYDYVNYLDPVPNNKMHKYYLTHDVLVLPSQNEAIGMVVPEAMLYKVSTITSDTIGANTYVRENKTGLIFKTGDYKDLADKIISLRVPVKLKQFGEEGSRIIKEDFTIDKISEKFMKCIFD